MKRLLLVDGHSLAYRAFYALPVENFGTSSGQPTNAIYGFSSMLLNLIRDEEPTHIAVAFDVSRKTFRSEKFPEYKAQRAKTPDEFRSQMDYLYQMVTALGIRTFAIEGFEADDVIATFAKEAESEEFEVLISTGDRDSFQLISERITVLYPRKGMSDLARMTPDAVKEKYGLTPSQYHDFAALRGDPSDNLPSVPGVGEKTATKWIQDYGDIQGLLSHADEIPGKVGESLRAHVESVKLNHELTQLIHDVDVKASVSDLEWKGFNSADVLHLLDQLEIKALRDRIKSMSGEVEADVPLAKSNVDSIEKSSKEISSLVSKHSGDIAFHAEIIEGKITGYSVALDSAQVFVDPSGTPGEWLSNSRITKIVHGSKILARYLDIQGVVFDTELAAYLINPGGRNISIEDLVERYLGLHLEQEVEDLFSTFNGSHTAHLHTLRPMLQKEIDERKMGSLLLDLELPTSLLLAQMEATGIAVDRPHLNELVTFFRTEVATETESAHKHAGREFNVGSPKQLQVILFDELKLPKTKKIKTGFTTDAESLEWLAAKTGHPLLQNLLRIRETSKLMTTIDGLLAATSTDNRIHTTFQQTTTATGRLSSTDPNLQNIPVRTEEGRRIRDCFIASSPYEELLTADYSQIEMRIMAHLSQDAGLTEAFHSGEDLHNTVASRVFGVDANQVNPEMRRQIKAMSYGLAYGLSAFGLSQQLDLSPTEASTLMGHYFERFGGIRDYLKNVVEEARKVGYTETILGRRRYLPDLSSDNRQRRETAERMALNAPIQGSAADIIKVAMLNVHSSLVKVGVKSRLLLQVHDELIIEIFPGERDQVSHIVKTQMENAVKLSLPLAVNIGTGKSWDLAAH
ncbi:MAG: DNA polymerase I [Actinomycetes bacterium]